MTLFDIFRVAKSFFMGKLDMHTSATGFIVSIENATNEHFQVHDKTWQIVRPILMSACCTEIAR